MGVSDGHRRLSYGWQILLDDPERGCGAGLCWIGALAGGPLSFRVAKCGHNAFVDTPGEALRAADQIATAAVPGEDLPSLSNLFACDHLRFRSASLVTCLVLSRVLPRPKAS